MPTNLIILRRKLVQTLLNDMVPVQVLDEDDDVQAQRENDRMDLARGPPVSLHRQTDTVAP